MLELRPRQDVRKVLHPQEQIQKIRKDLARLRGPEKVHQGTDRSGCVHGLALQHSRRIQQARPRGGLRKASRPSRSADDSSLIGERNLLQNRHCGAEAETRPVHLFVLVELDSKHGGILDGRRFPVRLFPGRCLCDGRHRRGGLIVGVARASHPRRLEVRLLHFPQALVALLSLSSGLDQEGAILALFHGKVNDEIAGEIVVLVLPELIHLQQGSRDESPKEVGGNEGLDALLNVEISGDDQRSMRRDWASRIATTERT
eukprot:scaffold368_cov258-Pinguiococcus_pyrenoidosus.AAC.42